MTPKQLRRVMIANDSLDGMERALDKAAMIEHYSGAEVLVVATVYDRIAEEPAEVLPRHEQAQLIEALKAAERQALQRLVEPYRPRLASLETRLVWAKNAADGIVEAASRWNAELLIKPVSEHHPIADYLHTPLDWALTRHAPCAVLISKGASWTPPGPILAAVDVADEAHHSLSREVLRMAGLLASILGTELHVVTAYPDLGQSVNELQVATDYAGIKTDMWESRSRLLSATVGELALTPSQTHVLEGKPGRVIPALVRELKPALTVLGTAARRGLSKLVIGNTSEDLVGRIEGDLVTVRDPWS
ncbi:MAG: universal stress protein [Pseudomonadales bacterium]